MKIIQIMVSGNFMYGLGDDGNVYSCIMDDPKKNKWELEIANEESN